jgi:hypothetical protein
MKFFRTTVERKVVKVWGRDALAEIMAILDGYPGPERERVQLAIIELSDGRVETLPRLVRWGSCDYRDVLAPLKEDLDAILEEPDPQKYVSWSDLNDDREGAPDPPLGPGRPAPGRPQEPR